MRQTGWLLPLLFVGCSCQRPPPVEVTAPAAMAAADAAAVTRTDALLQQPALDLLGAVHADAPPPHDVLQRYMVALLNHDQAAIDAAWALPPSDPRRAEDAALRLLPEVAHLRLQSRAPEPVGTHMPPQLLEVPVTVRASTAHGTFRYEGWYRMQPNGDGSGWVIQSAKLQPTLH